MTVFMTPDGKPFYGGTYFPPEDRGGLPAFPRVLEAIASAYRNNRSQIVQTTEQLLAHMRQASAGARGLEPLTTDVMNRAFAHLAAQFDGKHGGFGLQPKFPQPMVYEFLLRQHLRTGDPEPLEMVEMTLDRMAMGGIYDQLRGGFHRYSVDTFWLAPHFEKMLYDNALLARLYLHAYQVTEKALYRQVVEETLDYVLAEMTDESGGFYSAQDADSEGEEGKFFVWRPEAVVEVLGKEDGEVFNRYFDVTIDGNFEGMSILNVKSPAAKFAAGRGDERGRALYPTRPGTRGRLLEAREERVRPGLDDKVLTSWNGLMLAAFAEAGIVLGRSDYTAAASRCAGFLLDGLRDGYRLLRTYKGGEAKLKAYLEDYAYLVSGLLLLHEATFEGRWLQESIDLGRGHGRPVLGRRRGAVLRYRDGPRGAGGQAARHAGQRHPIGQRDGRGRPAQVGRHHRGRRAGEARGYVHALDHGAHVTVPDGRGPLAVRAGLLPGDGEGGRGHRGRRRWRPRARGGGLPPLPAEQGAGGAGWRRRLWD